MKKVLEFVQRRYQIAVPGCVGEFTVYTKRDVLDGGSASDRGTVSVMRGSQTIVVDAPISLLRVIIELFETSGR